MAAFVNSHHINRRENVVQQLKIQQFFKTGADEVRKCDSRTHERIMSPPVDDVGKARLLCEAQRSGYEQRQNLSISDSKHHNENAPLLSHTPPPSYDDAITDQPPIYSTTEELVRVNVNYYLLEPPPVYERKHQSTQSPIFHDSKTPLVIDFSSTTNVRTHGKSKANKAAKNAAKAKWAGSEDGGEKKSGEGEEEGANGGGGGGGGGEGGNGGGNNGDGGAGDGDGNGDDWDYGNKKGKKGKKGRAAAQEEERKRKEEEEKKRREEEEKKKEKDDEGEATFADEWGDSVENAGEDANAEDEWSGFLPGKKNKKGKKGKAADPVIPESAATSTNLPLFDNIDLDTGVPTLDLNFENTDTKTFTSGGLGTLGGFTSSWNNPGSKWDFSGATVDTTTKAWSLRGNNVNSTVANDFDFGDFGASAQAQVDKLTTEEPSNDDDGISSFTVARKEKKKGKKGATGEQPVKEEPLAVTAPESEPAAEDEWAEWGSKNKKKSKKGGISETDAAKATQTGPPPPQSASENNSAEANEPWGSVGAQKGKKKGKKGLVEEPIIPDVPETTSVADGPWDSFGKKEKRGKKAGTEEPAPAATSGHADGPWGSFDKKEKKGKKADTEESAAAVTSGHAENPWGSVGKTEKKGKKDISDEPAVTTATGYVGATWTSFSKKEQNSKNGELKFDFESSILDAPDATQSTTADTWGFPGFSQKEKKGIKKGVQEVKEDPMATTDQSPAATAATTEATDDFMGFGTGKKSKRNKKATVAETNAQKVSPPPPKVPDVLEDFQTTDGWDDNGWGGSSQKDKKDDKKDEKIKKGRDAENEFDATFLDSTDPVMTPDEIDEPKVEVDDWPTSTWGTSAKSKKKKAGNKKNVPVEVNEETPNTLSMQPESIVEPKALVEEDSWANVDSKNDRKKKGGKKSVLEATPPPAPTPPNMGLTPDPTPASSSLQNLDEAAEDEWGALSFTPAKTAKGKKDSKKGVLGQESSINKVTRVEEVKLGKKGPKESPDDIMEIVDESIIDEEEPEEEQTPAKATKSFWGNFGSTSTKPKTTKEKEKEKKEKEKMEKDEKDKKEKEQKEKEQKEREEKAERARKEAEWNAVTEEPGSKKGSKAKIGSSLTKVDSKASKSSKTFEKASDRLVDQPSSKVKEDDLIDIVTEEPPAWTMDDKSSILDSKAKTEEKKNDSWGFWGAKKLTPAKAYESKKGDSLKDDSANQISPLDQPNWNDPEPVAEATTPMKATSTKKTASVKAKSGGIADKIKAFEKVKDSDKDKKAEVIAVAPPPQSVPVPDPEVKEEPPLAKKANTSSKSKTSSASKAASKKKEPSPDVVEVRKDPTPPAAVPGSFPSEGADDDIVDVIDLAPAEKRINKNNTKKPVKQPKMDPVVVETPSPPPAPPTPPPEPVAAKPAKKERARVVRDEGASSWGFWGAAPKAKEVKKEKSPKDSPVSSPPPNDKASAPGLTRSISARKAPEKEADSSKSSGSDKPAGPDAKPTKSRGMSLTQFLAGAPPSRSKSMRQPSSMSKSGSRRQSLDIDAGGILTPPRDDQLKKPEVSAKAAKLMGMKSGKGPINRRQSISGKEKARDFTDPYALEDDLVMVEGEDDIIDVAPSVKKGLNKAARQESTIKSKSKKEVNKNIEPPSSGADDLVMVDVPGPSTNEPNDVAAVETPRALPAKRSASNAKRPDSKLMGLFGSFRSKPRRQSESDPRGAARAVYATEEVSPRKKRAVEDDGTRRIRRDRRDVRSTDRSDPTGASTEAEDEEARRAERRARRIEREMAAKEAREAEARAAKERQARKLEAERAEIEARKARAREARERREREEEERELRREEEKRARRAAREERRAREEQAIRDAEAREAERRQRRRTRRRENEPQLARAATLSDDRPRIGKSDRRRSHVERPSTTRTSDEDAERRKRHDERRARRTPRERPSRRKSAPVPAPVNDYFDPRNASQAQEPEPFVTDAPLPYVVNGPTDHTSSWVNSQIVEPAPPPPIEPTVIEAPEEPLNQDAGRVPPNERRKSRHSGRSQEKDEHRRSRRHSKRDPLSSEEDQYASIDNGYGTGYADGGARTFDGKAAAVLGPGAKLSKGSWWNKIAGNR